MLKFYKKTEMNSIKFITPPETIKGLFNKGSLEPENSKQAEHDPNSIFVPPNPENKKKKSGITKGLKVEQEET